MPQAKSHNNFRSVKSCNSAENIITKPPKFNMFWILLRMLSVIITAELDFAAAEAADVTSGVLPADVMKADVTAGETQAVEVEDRRPQARRLLFLCFTAASRPKKKP